MHYLALCAIAKDENQYLLEWIHYHILLGVERFILYDNDSVTPIANVLNEYVQTGIVEVIPFPGVNQQIPAYEHCLRKYGRRFRWIGFLDLDEYLVLKDTRDARILLSDYEDYGGLAVNWVMFGSSGHVTRPPGLQIENYVMRITAGNIHVKSIVQPAHVSGVVNAHVFNFRSDSYCVNEDRLPVGSALSYHTVKRAQINHYGYRSQQDFSEKLKRGRADNAMLNKASRGWHNFYAHLEQPHIREETLSDMAGKMKLLGRSKKAAVWAKLCNRHSERLELFEYIAEADKAVEKGDLDGAEIIMSSASIVFGKTVECLLYRASLSRLRRSWSRAMGFAVKALSIEPSLTVYYEIFLVHLEMGNREKAIQLLQYLEQAMNTYRIDDKAWRQRLAMSRKLVGA
jgi:hypothetical protein